jgi:hypothetical protein
MIALLNQVVLLLLFVRIATIPKIFILNILTKELTVFLNQSRI